MQVHGIKRQQVIERFHDGQLSSDRGSVLLREVERRIRILHRSSEYFIDHRDSKFVTHPLPPSIIRCEQALFWINLAIRRDTGYGKFKIAVILKRDYNITVSKSTVGRIPDHLLEK